MSTLYFVTFQFSQRVPVFRSVVFRVDPKLGVMKTRSRGHGTGGET